MKRRRKVNGLKKAVGVLGAVHIAEWFLEGRQVAAAAGIPEKDAFVECILKGFLWWKPLKDELEKKAQAK